MTTVPRGVWPVMLTPFESDGEIDRQGLAALVDWYVDAGVAGLFTVCLSSEMFELAPDERLEVAEFVVEETDGRVPVVATGNLAETVDDQVAGIRAMAGTGVDGVVLNVAEVADNRADEEQWLENFDDILERTNEIPLGLYECPRPYHRLLSRSAVEHAASSGRVSFLKDTCGDRNQLGARADAVAGTSMRIYNANVATLMDSLESGAHGFSGTLANVCPELLAWLCEHVESEPDQAAALQRSLTMIDHAIRSGYPAFAKAYQQRWGSEMTTRCRTRHGLLNDRQEVTLEHMRGEIREWHERLGIEDPQSDR